MNNKRCLCENSNSIPRPFVAPNLPRFLSRLQVRSRCCRERWKYSTGSIEVYDPHKGYAVGFKIADWSKVLDRPRSIEEQSTRRSIYLLHSRFYYYLIVGLRSHTFSVDINTGIAAQWLCQSSRDISIFNLRMEMGELWRWIEYLSPKLYI